MNTLLYSGYCENLKVELWAVDPMKTKLGADFSVKFLGDDHEFFTFEKAYKAFKQGAKQIVNHTVGLH